MLYKMKNVTCLLNGECLWCFGGCEYHPDGYLHPTYLKLMADELRKEIERNRQTKGKRSPETPAK